MSHRVLQRTIVRMLFDPEFAKRVLEGEPVAELTHTEQIWLREPDARAWRTDPERRARSLRALLEEFPASAALSGDPPALHAFYSTEAFHTCIREGGSLARTFGPWLASRLAPPADDVARIETAMARIRRTPRIAPGEWLVLSPHADVLEVDAAANDLHAVVLKTLGDSALSTLARGPVPNLPGIASSGVREHVLVQETFVERLPAALAAVLRYASEPRLSAEIEAEARRLGADAEAAREIVADLVRDGVFVGCDTRVAAVPS